MAIEFFCTKCGHKYTVVDKNAGKKFECKKCRRPLQVPMAVKKDNDEVLHRPGRRSGRASRKLRPLSPEAQLARAPRPPAELTDALQDRIHDERGRSQSAAPSRPTFLKSHTNVLIVGGGIVLTLCSCCLVSSVIVLIGGTGDQAESKQAESRQYSLSIKQKKAELRKQIIQKLDDEAISNTMLPHILNHYDMKLFSDGDLLFRDEYNLYPVRPLILQYRKLCRIEESK